MKLTVADLVDAALEATVVGGFSRVGYAARSRLDHWDRDLDMHGLRVLITGGTSGIGLAAAERMAKSGATVAITGRDEARLQAAAVRIAEVGSAPVALKADSSDLVQVAEMFGRAVHDLGGLDVLINNAGALVHDFRVSAQGFEQTYAVHVLAPFLLTRLAVESLDPPGKVITVSSGGMYSEKLEPARMQMTAAEYDGVKAYAKAKRVQVTLNEVWAERHPVGPTFAAMHPGWADTAGVQDSLPGFRRLTAPVLRTPAQGADTMVWLAATGVPSGRFWLDHRPRSTVRLPWTAYSRAQAEVMFDLVEGQVDAANT